MQSRELLSSGGGVLLDDASGRLEYRDNFLPAGMAQRSMAHLSAAVDWRAERRVIYGRAVAVPRLTASYRREDPALPPLMAALTDAVRAWTGAPFNAIGCNLYRDGADSVAMHNDHLYEIVEGQPIALLSLGGPRTMVIASKQLPRRRLSLELRSGSLLLMDHRSQFHYDHGVPKQRAPAAPRISLAFRVKPARQGSMN